MKRVLLVRLSALGDVVQSLGAVRGLIDARPDLEVHFVTQTTLVPLLEGLGLASVIALDRRGGIAAFWRSRKAMRRVAPDCTVDLQGNWKSAALTRLSGAAERVGADSFHRQEPRSSILLHRRVSIDGPWHPATVAVQLLREFAPDLVVSRPVLSATEAERVRIGDVVRRAGIDPDHPFSVFVVTDPSDNRAWHLAAMQRQAGLGPGPVLWLRGPAEIDVALPEGVVSLTQGPGQLRDLIALGGLVREVGGRVLGPDQGATHVLYAAGAPTIALYGPQDPARTAPPGATVLTLSEGPSCVPCGERWCGHPEGPVCMGFTTAEGMSPAFADPGVEV